MDKIQFNILTKHKRLISLQWRKSALRSPLGNGTTRWWAFLKSLCLFVILWFIVTPKPNADSFAQWTKSISITQTDMGKHLGFILL